MSVCKTVRVFVCVCECVCMCVCVCVCVYVFLNELVSVDWCEFLFNLAGTLPFV